jgi:replicative DNA helicase
LSGVKLPPQNLDAEISILGGLMLDADSWDFVADIIVEDDFYKPAHRKVFAAIRELNSKGQRVDLLTVSEYLTKSGELDSLGGPAFLAEVMNQTPTAANIKSYAEIVKEKSLVRNLISSCTNIVDEAYTGQFDSASDLLDRAEASIFAIGDKRATTGLVPANDILKESLAKIEKLYQQKASITGVASGYDDLDKMTAGFQPGEMIIIAARPSMGKTAFSLNIANYAAMKAKKKIAFFSVEMPKEQIMIRLMAGAAKINISDIRVGNISDAAWPKLISAASGLSEAPLFIDDTAGISPYEIRAKCRRLKAQHGLDMIMIDYVQIMDLKKNVESRERAVSEISRTLKEVAKELRVPVIVLAQLNRGVEGRTDRRPMLSDLRESGSLEQDADVILMLYRDDYYDKENPEVKGVAEVLVNKNRNGPTGIVRLAWLAEYGMFANLAPENMAGPPMRPPMGSPGPKGPPKSDIGGGKLPNFAPGPP